MQRSGDSDDRFAKIRDREAALPPQAPRQQTTSSTRGSSRHAGAPELATAQRSVLFLTPHFHAPSYRKTDIHLLAEALSQQGFSAHIATVGQSRLKQWLKRDTRLLARSAEAYPGSLVVREPYHPPSSRPIVNFLTAPLLWNYGARIEERLAALARQASIIFVEAGYALFYVNGLEAVAPQAQLCGLLNDALPLVGFRPEVVAQATRVLPRLHVVRVPAEALLHELPSSARGCYIPHGVEKKLFDRCDRNPYPAGTRNVVSVGNMLLDHAVLRTMAASRPDVIMHVIGGDIPGLRPANLVVHGEMPFAQTIPFIKFADAGVAAYGPRPGMEYLAQSSMKLLQYSYCGLPVLLPRQLGSRRVNVIPYDRNDRASIAGALEAALARGRVPDAGADVLDWTEVAARLLMACEKH